MAYKDPIKKRKYHLRYYHKHRKMAISFLGGVCKNCGSKRKLQFDHIDPNTKSFNINKHLNGNFDSLMDELIKCQLLCKKCHENKSANEKTKPIRHGTCLGYKKGCRCKECADFNSADCKRRYQERKARLTD